MAEFLGVFAKDGLPHPYNVPNHPVYLIANIDKQHQAGTHWIAMYINVPAGTGSYFDPYGASPETEFTHFMCRLASNQWIYNRLRLQSSYSTTCGQFCVMFVWYKCRGYAFDEFIDLFHDEPTINEVVVTNFMKRQFGLDMPIIDTDYLAQRGEKL